MHENRETSAVSRIIGDRSGKAICRKPDMHAVEGSDRAVVPMKLPNKEAQVASAEWFLFCWRLGSLRLRLVDFPRTVVRVLVKGGRPGDTVSLTRLRWDRQDCWRVVYGPLDRRFGIKCLQPATT
jgi:hypothetical protein